MRTLLAALVTSVMTIVLGCIAVLAHTLRIDEQGHVVQQWCMRTWAQAICLAAGVRVEVHGTEHLVPARGTVYPSNHVSWFDVFALASVVPRYTFVAKEELRRIPIFGWGAKGAGVIFLSRDNRKSAFEAYQDAAEQVSNGRSVVVFPEGTRGDSYALRPFKKGPFVLAIAAQAPVVPCVVHGAREVMARGDARVTPGVVHVHFLAPVPTLTYDYEHRHELMQVVWDRMAGCLRDVYGVESSEPVIAPGRELSA